MRTVRCPEPTPESAPFFEATAQGRLLLKHCSACSEYHHYPRTGCPFCYNPQTSWVESTGKGLIYSFSVLLRGEGAPYAIAYVTLDEGVTLITNIVDCSLQVLAIGMPVRVVFKIADTGVVVPMFTLVEPDGA